ncbi:MAG: hypothetical protein J6T96_05290 [Bacteroidales bacterium]|nr:hypothetical protein [Bacteroidales bacterium]
MCIAIYSPRGNDIPCEDYLKRSFEHNPDGAGFAFNLPNNTVQIEKGFMDYNKFIKAFRKANKKYGFKDRGVLIHFRITTHGGTNRECCHPFPLVADEEIMKKTSVRSDYAVVHNGIISLTSSEAYSRHHMSDTMVFIEKYLSKIATNKKWFNNKSNFDLIYDLIDSKMAILNGYGEIHSTQGFTKDEDGNWYSNTTYKSPRYSKFSNFSWFDDDDEYWGGYGYSSGYKSYLPSDNKTQSADKDTLALTSAEEVSESNEEDINFEDDYPVYDVPLMEVQKGDELLIGDEIVDVEPFRAFMSEDGEIFFCEPQYVNEEYGLVEEPVYYGDGWIFRDGLAVADFTDDYYASSEKIYLYS